MKKKAPDISKRYCRFGHKVQLNVFTDLYKAFMQYTITPESLAYGGMLSSVLSVLACLGSLCAYVFSVIISF